MKELKIINQQEVLGKNFKIYGDFENPLFLAKDVAEWIEYNKTKNGYYDTSTMLRTIDEDEKPLRTIFRAGQNREMWFLTEDGLYEVLMQSRKPIAKQFKKEVKKILKEIRNTAKKLETIVFKGNINGIVYAKDNIPMTTSRIISQVTGKEHYNVLRDIREEMKKLEILDNSSVSHYSNLKSETKKISEYQIILKDFKETKYIAENGQTYSEYELGELATMQILLKYSTEFRAKFVIAFQKMKTSLMNMFKVKLIEEVIPQDHRLRQYVYVIKNPLNETVKIGVAQNVEKRLKQLKTGAGIELELLYKSMICSNAFNIEKDVHEFFKQYRTFGEWFKVNPDTVIDFLENQTYLLKSDFLTKLSVIH